jgi:membrane-associated phospholipid phosphatase
MPARARTALIGAGISLALLALIWSLAFHTGLGRHADQAIFNGFAGLQRPRVDGLAMFVARLCNPLPFVALAGAIVAVALARRRRRIALAVAVVLVGANATTELLKPLLAAPRAHWLLSTVATPATGSWPSGHATAAMSLALALVLAVPARRRPVAVALGALFAVAVSYSFLTLGWHYPSDVLGGFLVAVIWIQLAVAGVVLADARQACLPAPSARHSVALRAALAPSAAAVAGVAAIAVLVALWRPDKVIGYATGHAAFIVGAAAIAALAFALSTAVMLSIRR